MDEQSWEFDGTNFIDEDKDVVKEKLVATVFGTTINNMKVLIMEYAEIVKPKVKRAVYDDSYFKTVLNDMMSNKGYELDIASMGFKKTIVDTKGNEHIMIVDETELQTQITNMANLYRINTGEKVTSKELLGYKDSVMFDIVDKKLSHLLGEIGYNNLSTADEYFERLHKLFAIAQDLDIFQVLMKHFVWQIKRRISEKSTYNDIMIALFGNQGIGKSFVIGAIFGELLGGFYNASISINNLLDDRWTRALSTQFLMNIEELDAGGDRISGQSMATLKKYLTGKEATYRPMNTNNTKTIPIKASFISTANFHLCKVLNDETGMRRFFEFVSEVPKDKRVDHKEVKWLSDNALEMFQSIDENRTKGYWDMDSEIGHRITAIQKTYITNSAYVFISENYEVDENMLAKDGLRISELYSAYEIDCECKSIDKKFRVGMEGFKTNLSNVFDENKIIKTLAGGNKFYCLKQKDSSTIVKKDIVHFTPTDTLSAIIKQPRKLGNTQGIEI